MKVALLRYLSLVAFTALPAFAQAPAKWIPLFDGKTLTGWQANENAKTWVVEDGAIVTRGQRSHLFYQGNVGNHDFRSFELSMEVMTTPGSNSGVYIHTKLASDPWPTAGYECQIINSAPVVKPGEYVERKMTGSIYAIRNTWRAPVEDNVWFEYRIKVSGKTIQTYVNGELICQYTEGADHWRANDKMGRRLSSGTIALQGHDPNSTVRFRDIKIRLMPDTTPSLAAPMADLELDELITRMSDQNFALIDLGVVTHGPSMQQAQEVNGRRFGYSLGYRFNQGRGIDLATIGKNGPVLVINDRDQPPPVATLKNAKAQGMRVAFSSGGVTRFDPARLKARLQAIRAAGLAWQDLWVP